MKNRLTWTYGGLILATLVTCLFVVWGVVEIFHEGWYAPYEWLYFLIPAGVSLALTLIALRWPRLGGALFAAVGLTFGAFVLWQFRPGGGRGSGWTLATLLSWVPVTLFLALIGLCFHRGRKQSRRRGHYLAAIGVPLLLGLSLAARPAYRVAHRLDDGYRGERLIQGNGVALYWAPAGPGWDREGGTAWNEIALYGQEHLDMAGKRFGLDGHCNGAGEWERHCPDEGEMEAYNICRYLSPDGARLMAEPQGIWRMPTTDELVRSLVRGGRHAGCAWDGELGPADCQVMPDKETPLWDPKTPVIYYWASDESGPGWAFYVSYNGRVSEAHKFRGLGSLGYRCVRE
jgi:hypothetical protein